MLVRARNRLKPPAGCRLFPDNAGNLVCAALFDFGEGGNAMIDKVNSSFYGSVRGHQIGGTAPHLVELGAVAGGEDPNHAVGAQEAG